MKSIKKVLWNIKRFLKIKPNMDEIKSYIKEQIINQIPAFEVEFFTYDSTANSCTEFVVNCHFQEENVKLLDLFEQGIFHLVKNKDRVRKFSRINAATIIFTSIPFFINRHQFDSLGVSLFLHYPNQGFNHSIRLYSTYVMLDEIGNKQFDNYRKIFPYFCVEGSHIEDLYSRKHAYPKSFKVPRLTEDCCDQGICSTNVSTYLLHEPRCCQKNDD
jgi:hypothetical protein